MANKYPSVPAKVLFFIAWRNLVNKKLRAFLTVFGIVIGIGAIFFLLSFGVGLQKLVTNQVVGNQSIKSIDISTPNSKVVALNTSVFQKLKNLPHVSQIGSSYSFAGSIKAHGSQVDSIVYGVDSNYMSMSNLGMQAGRLLNSSDSKNIVVNTSVTQAIGIKSAKQAIGKEIGVQIPLLNDANTVIADDYKIVGVTNDQGGNEIFIPGGILAAKGVKNFNQIKIESDNSRNVRSLRAQIETLGLQTSSPIDTVDQINQVFKFFNMILVGFGAIGMIVAVLGMFNTLTISLLERTKEIGLMIALGGRNRDMRKLFVFEALLLSFVGAAVGVIGAIILGQGLNLAMNLLAKHRGVTQGFQLFAVPWWLVVASLLFMMIIGLVVVFIPARRAAHIDPIDALRRE